MLFQINIFNLFMFAFLKICLLFNLFMTWTYLICLWHEHFYLTICLCLLFNLFVISDIWKFVHERVCLTFMKLFVYYSRTCSLIVREHVRLLFTNKLVKINRADLKPILSIITFKRAEFEHSLKNLNEHEPISNNLKNKWTIRK